MHLLSDLHTLKHFSCPNINSAPRRIHFIADSTLHAVDKDTSQGTYYASNCFAMLITKLLAEAKSFIPKSGWAETPLTLRATAGLRLLPKEQSEGIMGRTTG